METAQKTLLPKEEVVMWFEHLHQIAENRRAGAKKAAATRREKRCTKTVSSCNSGSTGKTTVSAVFDKHDPKELCQECGRTDLPDRELDMASWISCDGCLRWWHMSCLDLEKDVSVDKRSWLCLRCSEVW